MRTRNTVPSVLDGRRPYRELPHAWVRQQLESAKCDDVTECLHVQDTRTFKMSYEL